MQEKFVLDFLSPLFDDEPEPEPPKQPAIRPAGETTAPPDEE